MDGERKYHKYGDYHENQPHQTAIQIQSERTIRYEPTLDELAKLQEQARRSWSNEPRPIGAVGPILEFPHLYSCVTSLSDEFLNEYIPTNLELPVTWRDILLCGMIPEHRTHQNKQHKVRNEFLRPDIHFDKIEMAPEAPEAPSPAPIPEPVNIVQATEIVHDIISCTMKEETITIVLINDEKNEKYITTINPSDKSWIEEYSKYFHNNFNKFYEALNKTFTETNFYMKWSIKDKTREMVLVQISCDDDLFGFKIDIYIGREQNHVDKLENRVKVLEKTEEKYHILEKKVQSLIEIIEIMGTFWVDTLSQRAEMVGTPAVKFNNCKWKTLKMKENWLLE